MKEMDVDNFRDRIVELGHYVIPESLGGER